MSTTMDFAAMYQELKLQMDIIRRATAVAESIFSKLESLHSTNVAAPLPLSTKRKSEELISETSKKQCTPVDNSTVRVPTIIASTSTSWNMDSTTSTSENQSGGASYLNDTDFEFAAVRPFKKVFISRLPPTITDDILKRHVLKRIPRCENLLEISMLPGRKNAKYSSALISVGRDEDAFRLINSGNFWPPETIVHEHRLNNNHRSNRNGFRSEPKRFWKRR